MLSMRPDSWLAFRRIRKCDQLVDTTLCSYSLPSLHSSDSKTKTERMTSADINIIEPIMFADTPLSKSPSGISCFVESITKQKVKLGLHYQDTSVV